MITLNRICTLQALAILLLKFCELQAWGEISIHTDFEGGSAKVVSIDQRTRVVRFKPGGIAERGWPCWWFFRAEGLIPGEEVTFEVLASEQTILSNDRRKGKRIGLAVTGPDKRQYGDTHLWTMIPD